MVSLQNVQIIHNKTWILIAIYVISVLRHFCLISVIINNNSTFFLSNCIDFLSGMSGTKHSSCIPSSISAAMSQNSNRRL